MNCPICFEEMIHSHEDSNENVKKLFTTHCHHTFHENCILEWFKKQDKYEDYCGTCPVCRTETIDEDTYFNSVPSLRYILFYNIMRFVRGTTRNTA